MWEELFDTLIEAPDTEYLMIDSTIVQAHQQAVTGKGGQNEALRRPLRLLLTGGQRNDCTKALELIEGFRPSHVLADTGYDSQEIRDTITAMDAVGG